MIKWVAIILVALTVLWLVALGVGSGNHDSPPPPTKGGKAPTPSWAGSLDDLTSWADAGFDFAKVTVTGADSWDTTSHRLKIKGAQEAVIGLPAAKGARSRRLVLELLERIPDHPPATVALTMENSAVPPLPKDVDDSMSATIFPDKDAHERRDGATRFSVVVYEGGGTLRLKGVAQRTFVIQLR